MRVLCLGLDNSILRPGSTLAERALDYGELVEKYTVIVPSAEERSLCLSERVAVLSSGGGNKLSRLIKISRLAERLLAAQKYDIITVQDVYYLAWLGLSLARRHNLALEIQVHGFEKFYGWRKLLAAYVLKRADLARAVSQRLKRRLINEFGLKEEKITVVPIFSQLPKINPPAGAQLPTEKNGKFIFLTAGRLVKVKNIGLQIAALAEIVKKHPEAELWIAGDGPEKNNYQLEIRNYGLANNVKMLGWQADLEKYYDQTDAFLLTSNYEGWGLAVIEAACHGLPIIMTDVGCAGEVIVDDLSGLVIPVGDRPALAAAMTKIIEDEVLRRRLGEAAKKAAAALPDKKQTLNLYRQSWQRALASRNRE